MFNEAQVSLVGYVATEPSYRTVGDGLPLLSMRVGWTNRRRDRATGEWADGQTSFVTVNCWRKLAENLSTCLRKGDPVLVRGRLDVRSYVNKNGERRFNVDVDANSVGHDLTRGVARFQRAWPPAGRTAAEVAAGDAGQDAAANGEAGHDPAALAVIEAADDDMFDDSAIDALAKEADSAAAPF